MPRQPSLKKSSYSAGTFSSVPPHCLTKPQYDRRLGMPAPSLKYCDTFPVGSDNNSTYVWPAREPVETHPQWKPQQVAKVNKRQNSHTRVQTRKSKKRDDPKTGSDVSPDTKAEKPESVASSVEKGEGDKVQTAGNAMDDTFPSDENGKREMQTVTPEEIKRDDEVKVGSDGRAIATDNIDKTECESLGSKPSPNSDKVSAADKTEGQKPEQIASEEKQEGDEIPTVTDPMDDEARQRTEEQKPEQIPSEEKQEGDEVPTVTEAMDDMALSQLSTNQDEEQKPKQIPSSETEENGMDDKMPTVTEAMDDEAFNSWVTTYLNGIFSEAVKVFQKLEPIPSLTKERETATLAPEVMKSDDDTNSGSDGCKDVTAEIKSESEALSSELSTNTEEVSVEDNKDEQKLQKLLSSEEDEDVDKMPTATVAMEDEACQLSTNQDEEQKPKQIPSSETEEDDKMPTVTDPMDDEAFNTQVTTYLNGIFAEAVKVFQKLEPIPSLTEESEMQTVAPEEMKRDNVTNAGLDGCKDETEEIKSESEALISELSTNPENISVEDSKDQQKPKQVPSSEENRFDDKMPTATDAMDDEALNTQVTTYLNGIFAEAVSKFQKLEQIPSLIEKQEQADKLPPAANGINNKDVYDKLDEVEMLPIKKRNHKIKKRVSRMLKRLNCIKKAEADDHMAKVKKTEIKEKKTTILGNLRKGARRCFARFNRFRQNLAN